MSPCIDRASAAACKVTAGFEYVCLGSWVNREEQTQLLDNLLFCRSDHRSSGSSPRALTGEGRPAGCGTEWSLGISGGQRSSAVPRHREGAGPGPPLFQVTVLPHVGEGRCENSLARLLLFRTRGCTGSGMERQVHVLEVPTLNAECGGTSTIIQQV